MDQQNELIKDPQNRDMLYMLYLKKIYLLKSENKKLVGFNK